MPFDENLIAEMFAVANRGYITGFLEKNPGALGENIGNNQAEHQIQQFCAVLKGSAGGNDWAVFSVRNRIEKGDEIEAIFPGGEFKFKIAEMETLEGKPLLVAHGGGQDIRIKVPSQISDYTILRKKLDLNYK
jgi:putative protease